MKFAFVSFQENQILDAVNQSLKAQGSKVSAKSFVGIDSNIAQLTTARGACVIAILGSFSPSMFFVRGVHRVIDKSREYTYLFNGQAGKNLQPLAHQGEGGKVHYSDIVQYTNWLSSSLPHASKDVIAERVTWEAKKNPLIRDALNKGE